MLRDEFQMTLQELEGMGRELLERLTGFEPDELCPGKTDSFESLLQQRRELLQQTGELSRAHGDLPDAGNLERAQVSSVIDHLLDEAGLHAGALARLAQAERDYRARVESGCELDWPENEREILRALAGNAEALADLLEGDAGSR